MTTITTSTRPNKCPTISRVPLFCCELSCFAFVSLWGVCCCVPRGCLLCDKANYWQNGFVFPFHSLFSQVLVVIEIRQFLRFWVIGIRRLLCQTRSPTAVIISWEQVNCGFVSCWLHQRSEVRISGPVHVLGEFQGVLFYRWPHSNALLALLFWGY